MVADPTRTTKRSGTRKSRGRGLRTKTGCVTCRKRHLKCDETRPVCQNCSKKNQRCLYESGALEPTSQLDRAGAEQPSTDHEALQYPASGLIDAESGESPGRLEENDGENPELTLAQDPIRQQDALDFTSPNSVGTGSAANQPIGIATARWFEMIVEDANLTLDSDDTDQLLRPPEGIAAQQLSWTNTSNPPHSADLHDIATNHRLDATDFPGNLRHEQSYPEEVFSWRSSESFRLGQYEELLFARFTTHISQWIDLFDPYRHFASLVPRLAIHNVGLMNAILAVSARHNSVVMTGDTDEKTRARDSAIKYYHESLHYVRIAMQDTSYHTSLELLATTLIISAFEMLDGSTQDWQRHLEGVFWIQRSQVIHGDSGGLRGAVWWAWLCQDIWAAFRSKRRVFTFWQPTKKFHDLNPTQLAARAVFLLGRVVNYCVKEISGAELTLAIATKLEQARSLSSMLDEWESFLTQEFMPLPCYDTRPGSVFKPVWIHPPIFASAMQLYHVSRLLICLHQPSLGGFHEHEKRQVTLNKHIDMICGIALKLTDYGPSIASSMSLFIAGTCTNGQARRRKIVSLLEECRVRTGWPVRSLSDELLSSWQEPTFES